MKLIHIAKIFKTKNLFKKNTGLKTPQIKVTQTPIQKNNTSIGQDVGDFVIIRGITKSTST